LIVGLFVSTSGTEGSNSFRSANESLRTNAVVALFRGLG
jgi:hypothetical protein